MIQNTVAALTFESDAGGWFDRLLQTEKAGKVTRLLLFGWRHPALPQPVKLRHSPAPALRVNSRVHIPGLDKQRPGRKSRRRRRKKKIKTGKREEDRQHSHQACVCTSRTQGTFGDWFQPPDWTYKCLSLVNTASVCVCFGKRGI